MLDEREKAFASLLFLLFGEDFFVLCLGNIAKMLNLVQSENLVQKQTQWCAWVKDGLERVDVAWWFS